jgi:hypothetical protein
MRCPRQYFIIGTIQKSRNLNHIAVSNPLQPRSFLPITAHPPLRCLPDQLRQKVQLFLRRTSFEFVFSIRTNSKHLNHIKVLGWLVIIHTLKPLRRHRVTLWIETILPIQTVDAQPIPKEPVCSHRRSKLIVFGISIGQQMWAILLRKLEKPISGDGISVELNTRLRFRAAEFKRSPSNELPTILKGGDLKLVRT